MEKCLYVKRVPARALSEIETFAILTLNKDYFVSAQKATVTFKLPAKTFLLPRISKFLNRIAFVMLHKCI